MKNSLMPYWSWWGRCGNDSCVPRDWSNAVLVPIPKRRDLGNCDNWRGVALAGHGGSSGGEGAAGETARASGG